MKDIKSILGQAEAVAQLSAALQNKVISHAYLFLGPQGVGKSLAAQCFAAALNCQDLKENYRACGACSSCQKIAHGNYPDLYVLEPQGQSLKIEQIRDVQSKIFYKKVESKYQIIIIREAQKMTAEAANSLLKVLEEPPQGTVFILTAMTLDSMLPTILSRCQLIRFKTLSPEHIKLILEKEYGLSGDDAQEISILSEGSVSRGLQIWEGWDNAGTWSSPARIMEMLFTGDLGGLLRLSSELEKNPYLPIILTSLLTWFRDAVVWIKTESVTLLTTPSADPSQYAPLAGQVRIGEQAIMLLNQAQKNLKQNANPRLTIDVLFLKLCFLMENCK